VLSGVDRNVVYLLEPRSDTGTRPAVLGFHHSEQAGLALHGDLPFAALMRSLAFDPGGG